MPTSEKSDRVWIAGGAAAALLVLVLGYLLLIEPQNAETGAFHEQATAERKRVATMEQHLAQLRKENAHLDEYKAQLTADKLALPGDPDTHKFLLELRAFGDAHHVTLETMTAGLAEKSKTGSAFTVPVTIEANGNIGDLTAFLAAIQADGDRAALITAVSATDSDIRGVEMTISLSLFTSPGVVTPLPAT
jgi:Tfp pilus assembly protein PilO